MKLLGRSRAGCPNCLGKKTRTPLCFTCKGKGTLVHPKGTAYPVVKCHICKGKGRNKVTCYYCKGTGKDPGAT